MLCWDWIIREDLFSIESVRQGSLLGAHQKNLEVFLVKLSTFDECDLLVILTFTGPQPRHVVPVSRIVTSEVTSTFVNFSVSLVTHSHKSLLLSSESNFGRLNFPFFIVIFYVLY